MSQWCWATVYNEHAYVKCRCTKRICEHMWKGTMATPLISSYSMFSYVMRMYGWLRIICGIAQCDVFHQSSVHGYPNDNNCHDLALEQNISICDVSSYGKTTNKPKLFFPAKKLIFYTFAFTTSIQHIRMAWIISDNVKVIKMYDSSNICNGINRLTLTRMIFGLWFNIAWRLNVSQIVSDDSTYHK